MPSWREAFALSKSEVNEQLPPGTVRILDQRDDASTSTGDHIVKFPRPSSSARDPLNFPFWQKAAALLAVSVYAFVANFTSSVIAPVLQLWFMTFPTQPKTFSELSYIIAVSSLMLGASNIWWVPLSNWAGRRPVLIVATLLMTLCSVWCAVAPSFGSLIAARVLQSAGSGAADSVAPALIGDMYFIHQRGRAMAVYTIFLSSGSIMGGLCGGYIGYNYGWANIFWVSTALAGFVFLCTVLFVPETLYDRVPEDAARASSSDETTKEQGNGKDVVEKVDTRPSSPPEIQGTFTYAQSLGFRRPRGNLLRLFWQPWRTLALPGTWVVMLHYAGLVGGIVTISVIAPQLLAMPPYLWGQNAGLINVGGLIGTLVGYIYTFVLADSRLKSQAKHQGHGLAEPESRLPIMFFPLFIATAGFFVFGFCAQNPGGDRWAGMEVGYGMIAFGLTQVPSVGFNYLIDSYQHLAADCFTMVTILRAVIAFAWSFFVADWVQTSGAAEPFGIFGMLMGVFALLTVPLWLFGKRMRIATSSIVRKQL